MRRDQWINTYNIYLIFNHKCDQPFNALII